MIDTKTDKRIKYNTVFTLWAGLNSKYNFDFKVLDTIQNLKTKNKYLVLEFTKGYNKVNKHQLEFIKDILTKAYPKSEYKIITRQYRYAPEIKEDVLLALCK